MNIGFSDDLFSRKKNKISRVIGLALITVMLCGMTGDLHAATYTNASIQNKQNELAGAKEQVAELKGSLTDVQRIKDELENKKSDLDAYITQLDAQLTDMTMKIDEYNRLITEKEADIEQSRLDLEEAERVQEDQYESMKKRIRFMYESGDTMYLDMLFGAGNFSDMISKADYIEMLSAYDRRKLDEYIETTEYVSACKDELEAEKEVLDAAKEAVEAEQANVNELMIEKEEQVNSVNAEIKDKEAEIKEYEAYINDMNSEIKALEKAIADEIAALEEANRRQYNGGMFQWPCPAYTRISDDYGNRIHPTLGVEKFHNGIDLAAPYGSSILAAYDGDVVAADYSSSMGNYIMINHGSGIYTIYMHASALYVSKGQEVSKGQTIAAVGSTGRSTGNHLHFSVRQNGNYVSPWNYLK
ncbi:MAG: peptidoglycan DD-metalloendopeptidase family protein [Lachnospiraceae bacterium]|nr:peptidoglycan DD-metalloendopeptidase family protein [Lachnospiraceae bacterium]